MRAKMEGTGRRISRDDRIHAYHLNANPAADRPGPLTDTTGQGGAAEAVLVHPDTATTAGAEAIATTVTPVTIGIASIRDLALGHHAGALNALRNVRLEGEAVSRWKSSWKHLTAEQTEIDVPDVICLLV
ncbi:hypothetical protein HK104_006834 [Borealophlyctis nickersoniae]|nr:hypothetical protein HK104_006834 [Borealophlyctis nickersoniae]